MFAFALRARTLLLPSVLYLSTAHFTLAQTCVLEESFGGVGFPVGWDVGAPVEQQDANGNGLGTFSAAWTIGTSAEANAGGYFPVPDGPPDNRFVMANDDAPPCNCAMSSVRLTTPVVDLSIVNNSLLDLRYFLDGAFGADSAWVEASTNNVDWTWLAALPVSGSTWAWASVDLSTYDGQNAVNVRFSWSDNGAWASGFALDDVCVRGAVDHDLAMEQQFVGDPHASAFNPATRSLGYDQVPLQQAPPLIVAGAVRNRGHVALFNVTLKADVSLGGVPQGTWTSDTIPFLEAGARDTLTIQTDWAPASIGNVEIAYLAESGGSEDLPGDETAQHQFQVTGPGWADGDGAMALRNAPTEGGIHRAGRPYLAGCRYELGTQDQVYGLTVRLADGSYPGAMIAGLLLDGALQVLASTDTLTVTTNEIAEGLAGGWTFLGFAAPVEVAGEDLWAVMEQLPDSGQVVLASTGAAVPGSAILWDEDEQVWNYPSRAPLVRMHLAPVAVGREEPLNWSADCEIAPNPAVGTMTVSTPWPVERMDIVGTDGRLFISLPGNGIIQRIDVSAWPQGLYLVQCTGPAGHMSARVLVAH
ncbi:MAG: T9SS type A sorting domain-containing protein [Flavobacteriales bacterium]|nr:T9SS type A sorting domain-containing protein [Flavobacteriales bacterium]